jgi:flagellar hook protein FlgE
MLTSMANGTSALTAFQKALDIQSNNAANVNTTGFKSDSVSFSDMMYDRKVGMGTFMDDPKRNFEQGGLKPTNSEYDFAINGEGFFTLQNPAIPDKLFYSREGQFRSDKNNYLTTNTGLQVMGMKPVVSGDTITSEYEKSITSTIVDTETSIYSLNTYTTDYNVSIKEIEEVLENIDEIVAVNNGTATEEQQYLIDQNPSLLENYTKYTTQIEMLQNASSGNGYKSTDSMLGDIDEVIYQYENALKALSINPVEGEVASKAQSSITFPVTEVANDEYTLEIFVNGIKFQQNFEESTSNTLNLFSDKINQLAGITSQVDTTTGELIVSSMSSGENISVTQAKLNNSTVPVTKISEAQGSGQNLVDALYVDLQDTLAKAGALSVTNKSEILKPASGLGPTVETIVLDLNELGMSSVLAEKLLSGDPEVIASYPGIESEDGNIYLSDGDARFLVGKLIPVTFGDLSQLQPQGDNIYTRGLATGEPIYVENAATVVGKYIENSNVDLSKELVDLIVYQKAFEANSKSITTSDELLKTALALKNR